MGKNGIEFGNSLPGGDRTTQESDDSSNCDVSHDGSMPPPRVKKEIFGSSLPGVDRNTKKDGGRLPSGGCATQRDDLSNRNMLRDSSMLPTTEEKEKYGSRLLGVGRTTKNCNMLHDGSMPLFDKEIKSQKEKSKLIRKKKPRKDGLQWEFYVSPGKLAVFVADPEDITAIKGMSNEQRGNYFREIYMFENRPTWAEPRPDWMRMNAEVVLANLQKLDLNGKIGVINGFDSGRVQVKCNGGSYSVKPENLEMLYRVDHSCYDLGEEEKYSVHKSDEDLPENELDDEDDNAPTVNGTGFAEFKCKAVYNVWDLIKIHAIGDVGENVEYAGTLSAVETYIRSMYHSEKVFGVTNHDGISETRSESGKKLVPASVQTVHYGNDLLAPRVRDSEHILFELYHSTALKSYGPDGEVEPKSYGTLMAREDTQDCIFEPVPMSTAIPIGKFHRLHFLHANNSNFEEFRWLKHVLRPNSMFGEGMKSYYRFKVYEQTVNSSIVNNFRIASNFSCNSWTFSGFIQSGCNSYNNPLVVPWVLDSWNIREPLNPPTYDVESVIVFWPGRLLDKPFFLFGSSKQESIKFVYLEFDVDCLLTRSALFRRLPRDIRNMIASFNKGIG